jgi:hypothetical protein
MWWGLYKRESGAATFTATWTAEGWVERTSMSQHILPRKYRDRSTAVRKAEEEVEHALEYDTAIELWEHNEWNMPVKFEGNFTKPKS